MKLIIDVKKDYYEMIKYYVEHGQNYKPFEIIANGIPYEELSHEQECIIEELENICINNEYALDLLAKLKNKETPKGNLIQSLTELCNRYCENCPVIGEADDCTDCICLHIRGIMEAVQND